VNDLSMEVEGRLPAAAFLIRRIGPV